MAGSDYRVGRNLVLGTLLAFGALGLVHRYTPDDTPSPTMNEVVTENVLSDLSEDVRLAIQNTGDYDVIERKGPFEVRHYQDPDYHAIVESDSNAELAVYDANGNVHVTEVGMDENLRGIMTGLSQIPDEVREDISDIVLEE